MYGLGWAPHPHHHHGGRAPVMPVIVESAPAPVYDYGPPQTIVAQAASVPTAVWWGMGAVGLLALVALFKR